MLLLCNWGKKTPNHKSLEEGEGLHSLDRDLLRNRVGTTLLPFPSTVCLQEQAAAPAPSRQGGTASLTFELLLWRAGQVIVQFLPHLGCMKHMLFVASTAVS